MTGPSAPSFYALTPMLYGTPRAGGVTIPERKF